MSEQIIKLTLVDQLVGAQAPVASKVRAYLAMNSNLKTKELRDQAHKMAMQAINLARNGFGWNTLIREHVAGPGSPFVEVTIGHVVDRYEIVYFMPSPSDDIQMSVGSPTF